MAAWLGLSTLLVGGCATTAGNQWVKEAPSAVWSSDRENPPALDVASEEPLTARRPRLREVMTLGESYAVELDAAPPHSGAPSEQRQEVTVQVHNHNYTYSAPYGFSYGAPGWYGSRTTGWGERSGFTPRSDAARTRDTAPRERSPRIGQDWPAIRDHGPKFPFPSAPGNAWQYDD